MNRRTSASGMFAAFESGPFRWLWLAALSGNSGRFAVILVAGWEAYRLGNHSSVWPSMVSFLLLIPSMVIGPVAGGIADRVNRAKLASLGQVINAASCAVAGLLTVAGDLNLASLLILTGAVGIGNSIQGPAWQAMIPGLVGRDRLMNASMVTRIAQQGAELTGPAVGTVLLGSFGPGISFFACAAFYLVGFAMLWHIHTKVTLGQGPSDDGLFTPVVQGLSYVRKEKPLGTLLLWVGLHCSLTMASIGILPAVATENLHGDIGAYGMLLSAFGLGSVMGPLLMMWLGGRVQAVPMLVVSGFLSGIPLVVLGFAHDAVLAGTASAVGGAAQAVFMAVIFSSAQGASLEAMRGRVASVQLSLTTGAMGLTSLGWGALVGLAAPGVVLAIPGLAFTAACIPFAIGSKRISLALRNRMDEHDSQLSALSPLRP